MTCSTDKSLVRKEVNAAIDELELKMAELETVECPLIHDFVNGQYVREVFIKAGTLLTTRIHKVKHPYFVLSGKASVWVDGMGWQLIKAPYRGTTEKGTRRIIFAWEDTIWSTVHKENIRPKDNTNSEIQKAVDKIEKKIYEQHDNYLLSKEQKQKLLYNINGKL